MVNVIDVRQSYLQKVVREGVRLLGHEREAENSIHFSYEMVALTPATAKDAVKLRGFRFDVPCYAVEIELEIDDAAGLFELVRAALAAGGARGSRG